MDDKIKRKMTNFKKIIYFVISEAGKEGISGAEAAAKLNDTCLSRKEAQLSIYQKGSQQYKVQSFLIFHISSLGMLALLFHTTNWKALFCWGQNFPHFPFSLYVET